ncbi:MAG: glycogen synthase [Gloeocapsa sp. DLM2.Bin57]|nr:MAG: glycogen synthase [Gloeocapsa sp. DLM2.Bin57]
MKNNNFLNILIVSSENGNLSGAKVGGLGDFIKDFSFALVKQNCHVSVVIPSYGFLHKSPNSQFLETITFQFSGQSEEAQIFQVISETSDQVKQIIIQHPNLVSLDENGQYEIYHHDLDSEPCKTDASRYALFCSAVAEGIEQGVFGCLDCIHLNDWHCACLLILRAYHPNYQVFRKIRTVYTINNLSYQGLRPFAGDQSSLDSWYPNLKYDRDKLADRRRSNYLNLMKAGINLADTITTDSPSYAQEILCPSEAPRFYGGEGLEKELLLALEQGRLFGILLGCEYPAKRIIPKLTFSDLINLLKSEIIRWKQTAKALYSNHSLAYERLTKLSYLSDKPPLILTSVCRVVEQKLYLIKASGNQFRSGLSGILEGLGKQGIYILLGTGEAEYEEFLTEIASEFDNFLFLNGFGSEDCAAALYANGDLFLMPSSYEPCGISQMLAMRDGQPCLVHKVGGLKDTVIDGVNGFVFDGDSVPEQVDNFVASCLKAIELKLNNPTQWQQICQKAQKSRFLWKDTVLQYLENVYTQSVF